MSARTYASSATPGVVWFLAGLTPVQQDAYVERLFDDESVTAAAVVEEANVVALIEAHLRGDGAAINNLIDDTNEYDLFAATVGVLVAAFGEELVATVLSDWHRGHRVRLISPLGWLTAE